MKERRAGTRGPEGEWTAELVAALVTTRERECSESKGDAMVRPPVPPPRVFMPVRDGRGWRVRAPRGEAKAEEEGEGLSAGAGAEESTPAAGVLRGARRGVLPPEPLTPAAITSIPSAVHRALSGDAAAGEACAPVGVSTEGVVSRKDVRMGARWLGPPAALSRAEAMEARRLSGTMERVREPARGMPGAEGVPGVDGGPPPGGPAAAAPPAAIEDSPGVGPSRKSHLLLCVLPLRLRLLEPWTGYTAPPPVLPKAPPSAPDRMLTPPAPTPVPVGAPPDAD